MGKFLGALLLSIILLCVEFAIFCVAENTSFHCIEQERNALLKFKASLVDPSNRLSSWNDTDCCNWAGVTCDNITGRVIKLDLRGSNVLGNSMSLESNNLDSSLLELKDLNYLDLSWNYFQFSTIPSFLGSMKQLQYLSLTGARFGGIVPSNLGNLSNLHTLDLSVLAAIVDDISWVSNLSSLEYLGLSWTDLSRTKDLAKVLSMLPSLVVLSMHESNLSNSNMPHVCINSTSFSRVQYVDMSGNSFDGEFPCFLQNMISLRSLDLSDNRYNSPKPTSLRLKSLVDVDLSWNNLHHSVDWVSEFMWDKCSLKSLNLEGNRFHGEISVAFNNFSGCWTHNLEKLILGNNNFNGSIPASIGELSILEELDVGANMLSGPIPSSFGDLSRLRVLNLRSNQLDGELPVSLGQLSNLEEIYISYNSFHATLSEAHFANISKLNTFDAASASIKFRVGYSWVPPFQLKHLDMGSADVGGLFPQWLQTQKVLTFLNLSSCSISGTVPKWLMNVAELHLSENHIYGSIPQLSSTMKWLDLSDNMIDHLPRNVSQMVTPLYYLNLARNFLNGSHLDSLCNMTALTLLDLSHNHLSRLPDCWPSLRGLHRLKLSFNELSGIIPESIGSAYSLMWLQLNNNHFIGQLPSTLKNCTSLMILDVGENKLSGKIPQWIGQDMLYLRLLRLRDNEFHDAIPWSLCQSSQLQIIDLASNQLTGTIPHCLGNLSGMIISPTPAFDYFHSITYGQSLSQIIKGMDLEFSKTLTFVVNLDLSSNNLVGEIPPELTRLSSLYGLNLSHNHIGGKIPEKVGDMKSLESLDLSNNTLVGRIPESMTNLHFLSYLNLSNNNLSGQIPTGYQLQTLDNPSFYAGNSQLCGAPLLKRCHNDAAQKVPKAENHAAGHEDLIDKLCLYAFVFGGFAVGFWGFVGFLVFKRSWRQSYFSFIEEVISKKLGH